MENKPPENVMICKILLSLVNKIDLNKFQSIQWAIHLLYLNELVSSESEIKKEKYLQSLNNMKRKFGNKILDLTQINELN
jgi:hypothetical protein